MPTAAPARPGVVADAGPHLLTFSPNSRGAKRRSDHTPRCRRLVIRFRDRTCSKAMFRLRWPLAPRSLREASYSVARKSAAPGDAN